MRITCLHCAANIEARVAIGAKVVVVCPECHKSNKFVVEAPITAFVDTRVPWYKRLFKRG